MIQNSYVNYNLRKCCNYIDWMYSYCFLSFKTIKLTICCIWQTSMRYYYKRNGEKETVVYESGSSACFLTSWDGDIIYFQWFDSITAAVWDLGSNPFLSPHSPAQMSPLLTTHSISIYLSSSSSWALFSFYSQSVHDEVK